LLSSPSILMVFRTLMKSVPRPNLKVTYNIREEEKDY
jgi:hypothetical protein